eukprot:1522941-Alexandrium_andersonii.AAC.1
MSRSHVPLSAHPASCLLPVCRPTWRSARPAALPLAALPALPRLLSARPMALHAFRPGPHP